MHDKVTLAYPNIDRMKKLFFAKILIAVSMLLIIASCTHKTGPTKVLIKTSEGNIVVELFDDTPKHKANFLKLIKEGYYNGLLFHRVIQNFMIQAGDPNSRNAEPGKVLGDGDPGYTIDAEIRPNHFHRRGALAAARNSDDVNPEKKSSGSQFYIVQGKTFTAQELDNLVVKVNNTRKTSMFSNILKQKLEKLGDNYSQQDFQKIMDNVKDSVENILMPKNTFTIPEDRRKVYMTEGGTPHLDGNYTVFGQVVEGFDVIDKIASVETDQNDRPKKDVVILKIKVL